MSLKFIHTADLHIDSPMRGLATTDPEIAERVRLTTRRAFETLIDYALDEDVAFVVVAGDLFDGDWNDLTTGLWTIRQFRRLEERRIPVFVALGNHDRQNKAFRNLRWPSNVKIFSDQAPETFVFPDDLPRLFGAKSGKTSESDQPRTSERVALTGQSYSAPFCGENLAANYPPATSDAFNVGVLHTELGGDGAQSNYAPTGIETLNSKKYNYWALGHVHQRRTAQTAPCWIGYSGVLQGRHIRETEPKGFYVVELENGATVRPEPTFVPADSLRWFALELDLTDVATEAEFHSKFVDALSRLVDAADGRFAAVRVSLVGRTPLRRDLAKKRVEGTLGETLRAWASDRNDELWLEEIELKTTSPRDATLGSSGLLGDLASEFDRKIARLTDGTPQKTATDTDTDSGPDAISEAESLLADLRKRVGPFLKEVGVDFSDPATLRRWNEEAREILTDAFDGDE